MEILQDSALVFPTDEPELITAAINKSKEIGDGRVAVWWGLKQAQMLAELGIDNVPSPILRDYNWPGKHTPFDHQKATSSFLSLRQRAFCLSELGTGKTLSAIWAADYLMTQKQVHRVLVVCPLSVMRPAWQTDLFAGAMHRSCMVAHGSAKARAKIIKSGAEFVIINFDGLATVQDELMAGGFDLIIVDEATNLKNANTRRWKIFNKLLQATGARLWMMTGTPAAQSPLDAFGMAKLVNPSGCPRFYTQYRDKVMYQATKFRWEPRPGAEHMVHEIMQPAIRFNKRDCIDLPKLTFMEREAPLTPQQAAYYKKMKTDMLFDADGSEVTAVHAAARLNKLLQISAGQVITDDGETLEFDVSKRMQVLMEAVLESSNKVLVFSYYRHSLQMISEVLTSYGVSNGVIDGSTPVAKRNQLVDEFQKTPNPHTLVLQPKAAGHGLTLTAADTVIWYAPVTSVETYLQANARIDRPGQLNPMTVIHICGSPVERRLYAMLQGRIATHEKLIDLYNEEMKLLTL